MQTQSLLGLGRNLAGTDKKNVFENAHVSAESKKNLLLLPRELLYIIAEFTPMFPFRLLQKGKNLQEMSILSPSRGSCTRYHL